MDKIKDKGGGDNSKVLVQQRTRNVETIVSFKLLSMETNYCVYALLWTIITSICSTKLHV